MYLFTFLSLLYEIFYAKKPNIQKIRKMGLLATKIGQVYALRSDFLGPEKTKELQKLYEKNFDEEGEKLGKYYYDKIPQEVIEACVSIKQEPLAEASIGVVFEGILKEGNKPIVIKLIKKDFRKQFSRNCRRLRRLFQFAIFFNSELKRVADPIGTIDDIERMTLAELDLQHEIVGQSRLKHILIPPRDVTEEWVMQRFSSLQFHTMYPHLSSEFILVSDKIEGQSFATLLEKGELPYEKLMDFFFIHVYGMLSSGSFHEDIHSGNLFFTEDGHITTLDTGSIGFAEENIRKRLIGMFAALTEEKYEKAATELKLMSINHEEVSKEKKRQFVHDFVSLYADFRHKPLNELSLTNQMMQSIKMAVKAGFDFPRGMYPIIKSFMYLDGMALQCNPHAVLFDDIAPMVQWMVEQEKR